MQCSLSQSCKDAVDIVLVSSDGKPFYIHKVHLEFYSGGFPPFEIFATSSCETVHLTEEASVLDLLLRFMHKHTSYPNLSGIPFDTLLKLAESAVKYQVYAAIELNKQELLRSSKSNITASQCFQFLAFAVKHEYTDLADEAAPLTLGKWPLHKAVQEYAHMPDLLVPWVRFHASHEQIALSIICDEPPQYGGLHKGGISTCDAWSLFYHHVKAESYS